MRANKLAKSIYVSMRKRPVEGERVERVINSIVRQLESSGESDITTDQIGGMVMEAAADFFRMRPAAEHMRRTLANKIGAGIGHPH